MRRNKQNAELNQEEIDKRNNVIRSVSAHSEVSAVDHDRPLSKPQALVNLDRCLAHLAACGVDVIGIQASGQYTFLFLPLCLFVCLLC